MIVPLNLPKANLKLSKKSNQLYVWCILRKKQLLVTPEEWVRQHYIHFIVANGISESLIASEYSLTYNGRSKRADIVVFNRKGDCKLIIECKAPKVKLSEETLFQIAQYNYILQVEYLVLTNGIQTINCKVDLTNGEVQYLKELPKDLI